MHLIKIISKFRKTCNSPLKIISFFPALTISMTIHITLCYNNNAIRFGTDLKVIETDGSYKTMFER